VNGDSGSISSYIQGTKRSHAWILKGEGQNNKEMIRARLNQWGRMEGFDTVHFQSFCFLKSALAAVVRSGLGGSERTGLR
jgi:hypothetical protein